MQVYAWLASLSEIEVLDWKRPSRNKYQMRSGFKPRLLSLSFFAKNTIAFMKGWMYD